MTYQPFDIQSLTRALQSLSGLTSISFFIYDDRQHQIISLVKEDALLSSIKAAKRGQELYAQFLNDNLKLAIKRKEPFLAKGPTAQYHVFIPLHYEDVSMVALGEAFYDSPEDFKKFYGELGFEFGLMGKQYDEWLKELTIIPAQRMEEKLTDIHSLIEILLVSGYKKEELFKQSQWSKTIINLIANIGSGVPMKDIQQILVDAVIFLFNADTAAVFVSNNELFLADITAGRQRDIIQKLNLSNKSHFVAHTITTKKPLSVLDSHELWHTGFPKEIISMYLFPLASDTEFFGFLGVFNSLLERRAFDSLHELCRLAGHVLTARHISEEYVKKSHGLELISFKIANLFMHYRDPQHLYDNIVHEALSLVGAEKCSLMLPTETKDELLVNAVSGMNKWLMETIKLRKGEGIAGKVYETGMPILVKKEEMIREYAIAPRPHYKTVSSLSLPLKIADDILGILNLSDKQSGEPFSDEDLAVLSPFTLQASILLKLCSCHQISEQMRELSITDSLTELYNRRYFNIRMDEELQRAKRYSLSFSLAIVDLDDFKLFNDTEGHLAGDHLLKEIASIMTGSIRANDILVRLGGEEFAIIMPQITKDIAFHIAERIRENIKHLIKTTWKNFPKERMTVSIGVAMYPDCEEPKENLLRCADKALYKAKIRGKDCTAVWEQNSGNPQTTPKRILPSL